MQASALSNDLKAEQFSCHLSAAMLVTMISRTQARYAFVCAAADLVCALLAASEDAA